MFTKNDSKEALLADLALFAGAGADALASLASVSDTVTVDAGTVLIQQDVRHSSVYVIVDGTAAVQVNGAAAAVISTGGVFGELAFFSQGPASATVTAQSELELLVIPFNRFDQVIDDQPGLAKVLLRNMADRLRVANQSITA